MWIFKPLPAVVYIRSFVHQVIAGFLSNGRKSLLAHPLAETFLHLKWLVRTEDKKTSEQKEDTTFNTLILSPFPVCLQDSDDQHASLCSLPHLLHRPGSVDDNRQAPPHGRVVRQDQGGADGGLVGLVHHHLHLHLHHPHPRDWTGCVGGGQVSSQYVFSWWYSLSKVLDQGEHN